MAVQVSAKTGFGIEDLLESLVENIPAPEGDRNSSLKALIFDSHYDPYRGVIVHLRVFEGEIREGMEIRLMFSNADYKVEETGLFRIKLEKQKTLSAGDVGYIIAGIKNISDIRIGDTLTDKINRQKVLLKVSRKSNLLFIHQYILLIQTIIMNF